jgi:hypothetical protein
MLSADLDALASSVTVQRVIRKGQRTQKVGDLPRFSLWSPAP